MGHHRQCTTIKPVFQNTRSILCQPTGDYRDHHHITLSLVPYNLFYHRLLEVRYINFNFSFTPTYFTGHARSQIPVLLKERPL
ncbi:hypothetical protein VN97_g10125, partial [Penicillium thymicola]